MQTHEILQRHRHNTIKSKCEVHIHEEHTRHAKYGSQNCQKTPIKETITLQEVGEFQATYSKNND